MFSKVLAREMTRDNIRVEAFTVTEDFFPEVWEEEIPIIPFEDLNRLLGKDTFEILISIGYKRMNTNRSAFFEECDMRGYRIGSYVSSKARCYAESIGRGNLILEGCYLGDYVKVGDGNILAYDTFIGHHTQIGSFNYFANTTTGGAVEIGHHCFFGMRSIINNNVSVGDYTLLGSGSVLSADTKPHSMITTARNRVIETDIDKMNSLLK